MKKRNKTKFYVPRKDRAGEVSYGVTKFENIPYISKLVPAVEGSSHSMGMRVVTMSLPRLNCLEKQI